MNDESNCNWISDSKRRAVLSAIIRDVDIIRFVMRDPGLSQGEIDEITGIRGFGLPHDSAPPSGDNDWFAVRSFNPDFFVSDIIPYRKGDHTFWNGLCDGYRTSVKLGGASFEYAVEMLDLYARRINAQLETARFDGSIDKLKSLIYRAPTMFGNERNPLQALLSQIGDACNAPVGLGDFIIFSPFENGYWSNDFGWVENCESATPFDSESDIYLPPGVHGDTKVVSFQREAGVKDTMKNHRFSLHDGTRLRRIMQGEPVRP